MPKEEVKENAVVSLTKEVYVRIANFLNQVHAPRVVKSSDDKVEEFKVKWTVFSIGDHHELWASGKSTKHFRYGSLFITGNEVKSSFNIFSSKAIKAGFNDTVIEAFKAHFQYGGAINTIKNVDFIKVLDQLALQYEHKKQVYIAKSTAGLFGNKGVPTAVNVRVMGKFLTLHDSSQVALINKDAANAAHAASSVFENTPAQP